MKKEDKIHELEEKVEGLDIKVDELEKAMLAVIKEGVFYADLRRSRVRKGNTNESRQDKKEDYKLQNKLEELADRVKKLDGAMEKVILEGGFKVIYSNIKEGKDNGKTKRTKKKKISELEAEFEKIGAEEKELSTAMVKVIKEGKFQIHYSDT